MKLISKTLLYYLVLSIPLLLISGFLSYHLISTELQDGVDEALWKEKLHLEAAILKNKNPLSLNINELTHISSVSAHLNEYTYSKKVIYDTLENENVNYRVLTSYFKTKHQNYKIEIYKPTMEEEELMEGLLSAFVMIVSFLILAFFILNWLLSKTLWKPFYTSLEKLNTYEIKNHSISSFEKASTQEFQQLNESLNKMTDKIYRDFIQQKEFTENASHEMQTPLAVIKANIGLLIQSPHLSEEEMNQLSTIEDSVKKLASLNKALLLLAKIENNQFKDVENIDVAETIQKVATHLEDLLETKQIILETERSIGLFVKANRVLLEILFTNLLQNAIRHNFTGGKIKVGHQANTVWVMNTGDSLKINKEDLFTRFKKNENSSESLGLGLAIVKSICTLYGFKIDYDYQNDFHRFKLNLMVE
jgi:signal transduction histidine kinase